MEKDDKDKNKKDILRSIPFFVWIGVSFALLFYGAADQQRYWICGIALGSFVLGFGLLMLTSRESRKQHPFVAVTSTAFGVIGIILTMLYHFGGDRTREFLKPFIIIFALLFFAYMLIGAIVFEIRKRKDTYKKATPSIETGKLEYTDEKSPVYFYHRGERYVLTSHYYEPCLYIEREGTGLICTLHYAINPGEIVDAFSHGKSVSCLCTGPMDENTFCGILSFALDNGITGANFCDVAEKAKPKPKDVYIGLKHIKVKCEKCGFERVIYSGTESAYGERLIQTVTGKYCAYAYILDDGIMDELREYCSEYFFPVKLDNWRIADIASRIYAVTCDEIYDEIFDTSKLTVCPRCGSNMAEDKHYGERMEMMNIPVITHNVWNSLRREKKVAKIQEEIINQELNNEAWFVQYKERIRQKIDGKLVYTDKKSPVYFFYRGERYTLICHPYEPCLYIINDWSGARCTLHNAVTEMEMVEAFSHGESVSCLGTEPMHENTFCDILSFALDQGIDNVDFADVVRMKEKSDFKFEVDGVIITPETTFSEIETIHPGFFERGEKFKRNFSHDTTKIINGRKFDVMVCGKGDAVMGISLRNISDKYLESWKSMFTKGTSIYDMAEENYEIMKSLYGEFTHIYTGPQYEKIFDWGKIRLIADFRDYTYCEISISFRGFGQLSEMNSELQERVCDEIARVDKGESKIKRHQLELVLAELQKMKENPDLTPAFPRVIVDSWDYSYLLGQRLLKYYEIYKKNR